MSVQYDPLCFQLEGDLGYQELYTNQKGVNTFPVENMENLVPTFNCPLLTSNDDQNMDPLYDIYLRSFDRDMDPSDECRPIGEAFRYLHTDEWDGEDCFDWASSICRHNGIVPSVDSLEHLLSVTGSVLKSFTPEHFYAVAGNDTVGNVLFKAFRTLRRREDKAKKPGDTQTQKASLQEEVKSWSHSQEYSPLSQSSLSASQASYTPDDIYPFNLSISSESLSSEISRNSSPCTSNSPSSSSQYYPSESWNLSQEDFDALDRYIPRDGEGSWDLLPDDLLDVDITQYNDCGDTDNKELVYHQDNSFDLHDVGGPSDITSSAVSKKVKTNSRKGERGPKIWEFLMRLLVTPDSNPDLIRWEDPSNGTFRLVQPTVIAQLWGTRNNKPSLSANNFARAIRYHYNTGAITAVSEKHYVYKCGPKSLKFCALLKGINTSPCSSSPSPDSPKKIKKPRKARTPQSN